MGRPKELSEEERQQLLARVIGRLKSGFLMSGPMSSGSR